MSTPIRRSLYGVMAGDTTLNGLLGAPASGYVHAIYHAEIPQDASYPAVVFSKVSGVPVEAYADPDAIDNDIWLIKAIDRNSTADIAESIAARVISLINDVTLSISGAVCVYLRRQSDVEFTELVEGITFFHVGSQFRLVTS